MPVPPDLLREAVTRHGMRVFACLVSFSQVNAHTEKLRRDAAAIAFGKAIQCPVCGSVSHHPDDVANGYCGHCHAWTGKPGVSGGGK